MKALFAPSAKPVPSAFIAALALVASSAAAQSIDLDAVGDCSLGGGHGVQRMLGPGTYRMQPVRGAFLAWFRWAGNPTGCDAGGGNCTQGWTVYWDVRHPDGAIEHFPDAQVPFSNRWATAELAFEHSTSAILTLNAQEVVTFFIYDAPCSDNTGGVSLDVALVCLADFNGDKTVNSTDVSDFINAWFTDLAEGTLVTDWDHNGVVNSTDVSEFINSCFIDQAAGCG